MTLENTVPLDSSCKSIKTNMIKKTRNINYESRWHKDNMTSFDYEEMMQSLNLACDWIIEQSICTMATISQNENPHNYKYSNWTGAIREYNAQTRSWYVFGPIWHTGQAIKSLVMAYKILKQQYILDAAEKCCRFILNATIQDTDEDDFGMIDARENGEPEVSATSCMLEALDGLISLAELTNNNKYWQVVINCLEWTQKKLFLQDEGLFLDNYNIETHTAYSSPNTLLHGVPGRPLIDDAVFLKGYQRTKNLKFREVFYATAQRLLDEEYPEGNWIKFPPCDQVGGFLHPRQAYWWGRPMIMAWLDSGESVYLKCALRSANWYKKAQRLDGGIFRMTNLEFNTPSYGQATSGILSAACLWNDLIMAGYRDDYIEPLRQAIRFGHKMQFKKTSDSNLTGSILEKVLEPDGSDNPPFLIRDLGTIFYIQALSLAIGNKLL
ncbi:MAG: hypothetical protein A2Y12_15695 [Planctomycetes bacterium GWF2_42_9]|nr:MAG: hypothetical protein A2Y12_15695 [Planctomycetes bacterium GWF2_42_9]